MYGTKEKAFTNNQIHIEMTKAFILIIAVLTAMQCSSSENSGFITHSTSGRHTRILVKGSGDNLKIMHITDAHITVPSPEDSLIWENCARMHRAYEHTKKHVSGKDVSRTDAFIQLLERAKKEKVDLIALSGDIVNYPSPATVQFVYNELEKTGIPFVYVPGNHDWHLEGKPGSSEKLREEYASFLAPLYQGENPMYYSRTVNGINVLCIDNSIYQISVEQLDFLKKELAKGLPAVIVMHIPVYTPLNDEGAMANPLWSSKIDFGYKTERREPFSDDGNKPETVEFRNLLLRHGGAVVLCGHVHKNKVDVECKLLQLVTGLGRNGEYRIVEFVKESNVPEIPVK